MTIATLILTLLPFSPALERAFAHLDLATPDYAAAAAALDMADRADPEYALRNNIPYLRGQIAEIDEEWGRAGLEFSRIPSTSVLYPLALWHRARVAIAEGRLDDANQLVSRFGSGVPADLRIRLAKVAPRPLAVVLYESAGTREARWRLADLDDDEASMWRLLGDSRTDDIAREVALRLIGDPETSGLPDDRRLLLARTFHGHREFDRAAAMYRTLTGHAEHGPEARYQLARTFFQRTRYDEAIARYADVIAAYPDSDEAESARAEIASAYWRQLDFVNAEGAYLNLVDRAEDRGDFQSAVRDLVDIYRSQGDVDAVLDWVNRGLANRPSVSERSVLVFSRAKALFDAGRWAEALDDFRALRGMTLRSVANGTTAREVQFFEALSLDRLGHAAEARTIWSELARDPFTYYGLQSLDRLDDDGSDEIRLQRSMWQSMGTPAAALCRRNADPSALESMRARRLSRTRGFRTQETPETDLVGELVFLRQWDEAFYFANRVNQRWRDDALADLAYLAQDFRQAMLYGDRLRPADDRDFFSIDGEYDESTRMVLAMTYPAAYSDILCREAAEAGVDPLWLRAIIWQESRYDAEARSEAAARGLMQFIPETATAVATRMGMGEMSPDRMYQPEVSIRLGANYWAELLEEFGSPEMALAAYNGGPENVRRWSAKTRSTDPVVFLSDIGFTQTKDYVSRIFGLYARYRHLQDIE
jgi:soluble lytic murein transglycosylase